MSASPYGGMHASYIATCTEARIISLPRSRSNVGRIVDVRVIDVIWIADAVGIDITSTFSLCEGIGIAQTVVRELAYWLIAFTPG